MGNNSFRNILLFSLFAILGGACSSVQKLNDPPGTVQEPYFRALGESANVFVFRESETDHRVRKNGHEIPVIAFAPIEYPKSVDPKLASFFGEEFGLLWREIKFSNAKIATDAWKTKQLLLDEVKKKDVDALVYATVTESDSGWVFRFQVKDAVEDGSLYGDFEAAFKKPVSSEESGTWSQAVFWKSSDRVISLESRKTTVPVWDRKPDTSSIKEILSKSVRGLLSVTSSSGDTEVIWKGKSYGKTPLANIPLLEGVQEIQLVLKGKKPVTKTIQVRAGKKTSLYQEWEEDRTLGSAKIISLPEGLSVSIDGYKQGETPFFRSNLTPGAYQVELVKEVGENSLVYYEAALEVKPDQVLELALPYFGSGVLSELEFWKPSGESGFSAFGPRGLEFAKKKNLANGWNGVYSLPFIPEETEVEGYFLLPVDHKEGTVAITLHLPGLSVGLLGGKENVSVFQFPSTGKTVGTYKYKDVDKDIGRPFSFRASPKEKKLFVYLGRDLVWEGELPSGGPWYISLLTRSEEFKEKVPLKDLKIHYKGYK